MKKIFRLLIPILLISSLLNGQKVYFIYLQTENQQPFYTRIGEKIYNSTSAGYLILSNLRDSSYSLNIGIQGSQVADQPYSVTVNKKDLGFLIKNFGEKGWGLFNLSTAGVIMPSNPISSVGTMKTEKTEDNAFTNLLAKAADDSTIKEKPILEKKTETTTLVTEKKEEGKTDAKEVSANESNEKSQGTSPEKKEEPKVDLSSTKNPVQEVKSNDALKVGVITGSTVAIVDKNKEAKQVDSLEKQQDSVAVSKPDVDSVKFLEYKKSIVKLKSESSTTNGIGLVFLDMISDGITDTVQILIPAIAGQVTHIESKPEEKKFLDITSADSAGKETMAKGAVPYNNCKAVATEDDFYKLRKKMASQKSDDDMISEAKKTFKTKCFSTVQVRNLSSLFPADESKYKFYDAAYQYVSDLENFSTLQSTLKDEYYINRFKAMLRQY